MKSILIRLKTVRNLFHFLVEYKMWWMIPMVVMLFLLFIIIILGQSTPLGPLIYTIF